MHLQGVCAVFFFFFFFFSPMLGLAYSLRSSSLPRLAFVTGSQGLGRRGISRSALTMGYCHYWDYHPEKYELSERKWRFQLASDEIALLYRNLPEGVFHDVPRNESLSPEDAEKCRRNWLEIKDDEESPTMTSELVSVWGTWGGIHVDRDIGTNKDIGEGCTKTGCPSHLDIMVTSSLIALHRHLPLAFSFSSDGDIDGEKLWWMGTFHYQNEVGDPLGMEPGWAKGIVRDHFKAQHEEYLKSEAYQERLKFQAHQKEIELEEMREWEREALLLKAETERGSTK